MGEQAARRAASDRAVTTTDMTATGPTSTFVSFATPAGERTTDARCWMVVIDESASMSTALRSLVGVDVDVDVVDVGDAAGEALVGGGGDLVALVDGGGGVDVDGDVGDEAVAEPADLG